MKHLLLILSLITFTVSIGAQTKKAGTIAKIKGAEIIVKNEDPNTPFVIGEKLRLLTGDESVVLEVVFPMQTATRCKLIAGSLGKLKVGALVYSGGSQINEASADQNTPNTVALKNYSEDVSNIKLDDFNTFLGFNPNYTFDQFTRKYGKPTKIDRDSKYDFNAAYWDKSASYGVTDHVMTVFYDRKTNKIMSIFIDKASEDDPVGSYIKSYLLSKGNTDPKINFLNKSESEITNILGNPDERKNGDEWFYIEYNDKNSPQNFTLQFSFNKYSQYKCYEVHIQYNLQAYQNN